jgi:glutamate formiminotransferase
MLECVANLSEGRRSDVVDTLAAVCGPSLLDVHADPDHHRSVFTLAGPTDRDCESAVRALALAAKSQLDLRSHAGVHPRTGVVDVVPFVALEPTEKAVAVDAARDFAAWAAWEGIPALLYGDAHPEGRSLPEARDAARDEICDPGLGTVLVGARAPLVAVNCELDRDDVALARRVATAVRERDGGLPGVRSLGFELASRRTAQVSMNVTRLDETGVERACTEVRRLARGAGADVARVELVGLMPAAELDRCSAQFRAWSGIGVAQTIEGRLGAAARARGARRGR